MESDRRSVLVRNAKLYLDRYTAGTIPKFPTMAKIGQESGYRDAFQVSKILRNEGIHSQISLAEEKRMNRPYPPSQKLAWIMGYFSEHGAKGETSIAVQDETPEALTKYISYAEDVFGQKPAPSSSGKNPDTVFIHSKEIVSRVGDISRREYFNTIINRYSWLESSNHSLSFIEGLLEAKGSFSNERVIIHLRNGDFAEWLQNLIKSVGVEGVTRYYVPADNYWTVNISNELDLRNLAEVINLVTPKKEAAISRLKKHSHKWRIEEPNGPLSEGVCSECKAHRKFRNSRGESIGERVFNSGRIQAT